MDATPIERKCGIYTQGDTSQQVNMLSEISQRGERTV